MSLQKTTTIDGIRFRSRRKLLSSMKIQPCNCRDCAIYQLNAPYKSMNHMPRCQDADHESVADFCGKMLEQGYHVWFVKAT